MRPVPLVYDDLVAIGAACLPTDALVRLVLGRRCRPDEAARLAAVLSLAPQEQLEALRMHDEGPRLLAALELGRRVQLTRYKSPPRPVLDNLTETVRTVRHLGAGATFCVPLDSLGRAHDVVELPGPPQVAPPAAIFRPVLNAEANSFLLVRLTRDDDTGPQQVDAVDRALCARARRGAQALGLTFVDHLRVGADEVVSFREAGLLDPRSGRYRYRS